MVEATDLGPLVGLGLLVGECRCWGNTLDALEAPGGTGLGLAGMGEAMLSLFTPEEPGIDRDVSETCGCTSRGVPCYRV